MERYNFVFQFDGVPVAEHGNDTYFPSVYDFVRDAVEATFGQRGDVRLVATRIRPIMGGRNSSYHYHFLVPEMNVAQAAAFSRWCNENRGILRFIADPRVFMWTTYTSYEADILHA